MDCLLSPKFYGKHKFLVHNSYSELSECAATCDLCKFLRRECWFLPYSSRYLFDDPDFEHSDGEISIILRKTTPMAPVYRVDAQYQLWIGFSHGAPKQISHWRREDEILNENRGFEQLLEWPRRWLATCRTEHKTCSLQVTGYPTFLPTRLLDVGLPDQESIRLVHSKELEGNQPTEYVTLSYCWGKVNDAVCTTKDNIPERLRAIPTSSLPRTLQDAVVFTRALGVRYLWIDALCIIQTQHAENEDWQRELPNMGKIYKHSLLTLAASSAQDSSVGIFNYRKCTGWPARDYSIPVPNHSDDTDDKVDALFLAATLPHWDTIVESSPLSRRGWVLQERMLASRTLFWTADGLFWQCGELDTSEYNHLERPSIWRYTKLPTLVKKIKRSKQEDKWASQREGWMEVLEAFSKKTLTVATDRLPALAGLGTEIAILTGTEYVMGVFKHNLVQELAWTTGFDSPQQCSSGPPAARIPGVPSWSWASTNQALTFRVLGCYRLEELFYKAYFDNQRLCGRGRLGTVSVKKASKPLEARPDTVYYPTFEPIRPRMVDQTHTHDHADELAVFDTLEDALPSDSGSIRCLQWASWQGWRNRFCDLKGNEHWYVVTSALIVSPVHEKMNVYRRVGWLEVVDAKFFEDELRDITLV